MSIHPFSVKRGASRPRHQWEGPAPGAAYPVRGRRRGAREVWLFAMTRIGMPALRLDRRNLAWNDKPRKASLRPTRFPWPGRLRRTARPTRCGPCSRWRSRRSPIWRHGRCVGRLSPGDWRRAHPDRTGIPGQRVDRPAGLSPLQASCADVRHRAFLPHSSALPPAWPAGSGRVARLGERHGKQCRRSRGGAGGDLADAAVVSSRRRVKLPGRIRLYSPTASPARGAGRVPAPPIAGPGRTYRTGTKEPHVHPMLEWSRRDAARRTSLRQLQYAITPQLRQ